MAKDTIRTVTVRGREENLDAVADKLRKVGQAGQQAGAGVQKFGNDSVAGAAKIGDIDRELDRLQNGLVGSGRAFAQFESGMKASQRALDAGKIDIQEYSRLVSDLQQRLQRSIAPNLGTDVNASGINRLLDGQTKLDAATRRTIKGMLDQQQAAQRAYSEQADAVARQSEDVARLRAQIDPYGAAQARLNQELAEYNALAASGAISSSELAQATAMANQRFSDTAQRLGVANDNIRLSGMQMQNLGYQVNDVATMLLMGASPFQIIASQGGQVVQALSMSPGGVGGSLRAIGTQIASLATRTNLIVGGLTAAAGAAIYFATRTDDSAKTATEALEGYSDLITQLETGYERAADAATEFFERAQQEGPNVALARIQRTETELLASLAREIDGLRNRTRSFITEWEDISPAVLEGQQEIRDLVDNGVEGGMSVAELQNELAKIRIDPATPRSIVEIVDGLSDAADNGRSLEAALDAIGEAAADANQKMGRLRIPSIGDEMERWGGSVDYLRRMNPEGYNELRTGLEDQADAAEEAGKAAREYSDAIADQERSMDETVDALRRQIDMFGASEGAIAANEFRIEALSEARRAAREAGEIVTPEQEAAIERQAELVGVLTDQIDAMTEAQRQAERVGDLIADLEFETSIANMSDLDQDIARTLDRYEVAFDSFDGQRIAGAMRYNDAVERTNDAMRESHDLARDFAGDLLDGLMSGENALDSLIETFARLGQQFAEIGLDKLMDGWFGGEAVTPSFSFTPPTPVPSYTPQAAPVIDDRQFREVNEALTRTSQSAMDVALQFEGLNERADTGTLDSFLMASGNWNNLSASDTAWCAAFANAAISRAGGQGTGSNLASSFLDWGMGTHNPQVGDIVVLKPQSSGASGHVGFLAGFKDGTVQLFGGNQGNAAKFSNFDIDDVVGYRTDPSLRGIPTTQLPEIMARATENGVVGGFDRVGREWGMDYDTSGPSGSGLFSRSGMGVLGAGIGAFAGGAQSGNPLMGGISGAMSGFGASSAIGTAIPALAGIAGPVGMIGGAILGIFGGIFGKSKQKKQERQKARQELESQMGQITTFLDEISGIFSGPYLSRFRETSDELKKIRDLAAKAGDQDLVKRVTEASESFFEEIVADYERSIGGILESFRAGTGYSGAFVEANEAVKELEKSLLGLVEDAKFMANAGGSYDSALEAAGGKPLNPGFEGRSFYRAYNPDAGIDGAYIDAVNRWTETLNDIGFNPYTEMKGTIGNDPVGGIAKFNSVDGLRVKLEELGVVFDELGEPIDKATLAAEKAANGPSVQEAREAAQMMARRSLIGAEEFTEIEERIQSFEGTAAGLQQVLEKLDMSADEAATTIAEDLQTALDDLRDEYVEGLQAGINDLNDRGYLNEFDDFADRFEDRQTDLSELEMDGALAIEELSASLVDVISNSEVTVGAMRDLAARFPEIATELGAVWEAFRDQRRDFTNDLTASINDLSGVAYLNQITDAQTRYNERLEEAERLGLSGGLALTELNLAVAQIAQSADLSQDELDRLAKIFPEIASSLTGALGVSTVAEAQEAVDEAREKLRRAYEEEKSAIEQVIDRTEAFIDTLKDLRLDMRLDENLSTLDPRERMLEAQREFREVAAAAMSGDEDAQAELAGITQEYLSEARDYYASSEDYFQIWEEVDRTLARTERLAGQQLTDAQKQLKALDRQVEALIDIDESVMSVVDAIAELTKAIAELEFAQQQATGGSSSWQDARAKDRADNGVQIDPITKAYRDILGRDPSKADVDYWSGGGFTNDQIRDRIEDIANAGGMRLGGIVGAYAGGGIVGNGIWDRDSVLARYAGGGQIALAGGEGVLKAPSMRKLGPDVFHHINHTGTLPQNDNRAEIAGLRAEVRRLGDVIAQKSDEEQDVARGGFGAMEKEFRRAQSTQRLNEKLDKLQASGGR
ncbi:TIGR02594 family protein [Pararhizobium haloflavum]|uniref:TIGR02594 family protein n=1 Tax=Pararhizobium haloflavum TaxID=2037914 RepID=UPI000C1A4540|nr:TIGR02594 family protein [Pararhizobium haloflavum]